ncbi:hypothetical protein SAVIM40S_00891 [Streptomyces avidinii]
MGMPKGRPSTSPDPKSGWSGSAAPIEATYRSEPGCTGRPSTGACQKLSDGAVGHEAACLPGSAAPDSRHAAAAAAVIAGIAWREREALVRCIGIDRPHTGRATRSARADVENSSIRAVLTMLRLRRSACPAVVSAEESAPCRTPCSAPPVRTACEERGGGASAGGIGAHAPGRSRVPTSPRAMCDAPLAGAVARPADGRAGPPASGKPAGGQRKRRFRPDWRAYPSKPTNRAITLYFQHNWLSSQIRLDGVSATNVRDIIGPGRLRKHWSHRGTDSTSPAEFPHRTDHP